LLHPGSTLEYDRLKARLAQSYGGCQAARSRSDYDYLFSLPLHAIFAGTNGPRD
jgi:hypothetical protein